MKMQKVITKSIMKDSDKYTIEHKCSSIELMHKAAEAVLNSYSFKGKVLIVTGTGNNAGDGYALALLLNKAHIEVNILQTKAEYSNDGKYYYDLCQENNIKTFLYNGTFNFKNYDVLVDAIYGIGFHGNMPNQISSLINQMNESNLPIVSVDINSGLDADNGLAKTCIHSTLTVSIGALKPGHLLNMAKDNIDKLVNQNIGIDIVGEPYYLLEHDDFKDFLPKRKNFSHKGTYGLVGILGGSLKYSGSVKLASLSLSALTSGAGEVFNGYGATTTKSINPSDIIAGELIKRNFIIVPKLEPQLADKTLIVSYGETDRRYRGLGYTIEVTLQFVSAKSHEMVCSCTAEGQGETEADDIRMAIQRAISGLFRQRYY